jgi:hypothetical protein
MMCGESSWFEVVFAESTHDEIRAELVMELSTQEPAVMNVRMFDQLV